MSPKRVSILLGKEFFLGPKNFIFIWGIVAPIIMSLVISLVFGTLFSEKPRLGILNEDSSQLVTMVQELDSVVTKEYGTVSELRQAVETGAVDMGIVLPAGFDGAVIQGEKTEIAAYIWGESLAKDRTILTMTIADLVRELGGQEVPVEIESVTLGDEVNVPWSDRLLPFIILIAVNISGTTLPAISIIDEKQKKTLEALIVTPTTIGDIFAAKGLLGIILSISMGILMLVLNQVFGTEPLLLILVLALGSIMAVEIGLILGALIKDISTLLAVVKFIGIFLMAPVFIYLFPQIPQWIGRIFPTYYLVQPIVDISLWGGGWSEIAVNVYILIGLNLLLAGMVLFIIRRTRQY